MLVVVVVLVLVQVVVVVVAVLVVVAAAEVVLRVQSREKPPPLSTIMTIITSEYDTHFAHLSVNVNTTLRGRPSLLNTVVLACRLEFR